MTVVIVGGRNKDGRRFANTLLFTPATGQWASAAPLPRATSDMGATSLGHIVYVAGGWYETEPSGDAFSFDGAQNAWRQLGGLRQPRYNLGMGVAYMLDTKEYAVYAVGGFLDTMGLQDNEVFNDATGRWEERAPLHTGRGALALASLGGALYAIGGKTSQGDTSVSLRSVERFDAADNRWHLDVADMPEPRVFPSAAVSDGLIYVTGGRETYSTIFYTPATNMWTSLGEGPKRWAIALVSFQSSGPLYALGGLQTAASGNTAAGPALFVPCDVHGTLAVARGCSPSQAPLPFDVSDEVDQLTPTAPTPWEYHVSRLHTAVAFSGSAMIDL